MDNAPSTAAVVLAAGGGSRYAGPTHKLLAPLPATDRRPAETVIERSVRAALAASIGPVIVVTGAVALDDALARLERRGTSLSIVANPDWEQGQATSLTTGIGAARQLGAAAAVVGLGDQPGIAAASWRAVAAGRHPITVATYGGRRGHPVRLAAETWPLLPTAGDTGARTLMHLRPNLVGEVACEGSTVDSGAVHDRNTDGNPVNDIDDGTAIIDTMDIDTVEDLQRWQNS